MNGILSYLNSLRTSYKTWKYWKKRKEPLYRDFIPSQTYFKYPSKSTFEGRKVLNLGCGRTTYPAINVTNLHYIASGGINVVWDLSKTPLPFEDNQFDFIIANHSLEHIPNWWECFKEMARILKPGGRIEVWVPHISSDSAFTYKDHINRIGIESFTGIKSFNRVGSNLAENETITQGEPIAKLSLLYRAARPCLKWWVFFAPNWLLQFYSLHLRNLISEEGYFFQKES